ncbi:hypothetical protein TNCV_1661901 [Trichonephila clavipes]|nr:hypothetical protein TNCV_1661901 [Trichonephila clavipes]
MGRSDAAIIRCWQEWVDSGRLQRHGGSGRHKTTVDREHRLTLAKYFLDQPDISPIENAWDMKGRRLRLPGNVDHLALQLEQIWQEIPQETIRVPYYSMPRRVTACIQEKSDSLTHSLTNHDISGTIKPTDLKFGRTREHRTTPLRVKEDIEEASSELDNEGQRLHFLDEMSRTVLLSAS